MLDEFLTVDVDTDRRPAWVVLRGALDHFTAESARSALRTLEADGRSEVVVDLRGLAFMDSAGVDLIDDVRTGRFGRARYTVLDDNDVVLRVLDLLVPGAGRGPALVAVDGGRHA